MDDATAAWMRYAGVKYVDNPILVYVKTSPLIATEVNVPGTGTLVALRKCHVFS